MCITGISRGLEAWISLSLGLLTFQLKLETLIAEISEAPNERPGMRFALKRAKSELR